MKFDDSGVRFTRSVSEYNRQMEELMESKKTPYGIKTYHQACDRIRELRLAVNEVKWSKSVRQPLFAELRELESFWGIESISYNREGCGVLPTR